jgi:hypothetical protein
MKGNESELSVAEKIGAAIALHNSQYPGVPLSISSLAKQAGVSRANLYTSHANLIKSLKRPESIALGIKGEKTPKRRVNELEQEIALAKKTNKALLLLNDALRMRIRELNQRLKDVSPKEKVRR